MKSRVLALLFLLTISVSIFAQDDPLAGPNELDVTGGGDAAEPSTNSTFDFTLTTGKQSGCTFSYSISGDATEGADYFALGEISFGSLQTTASIPVTVIDDILVEGTETVTLTLLAPSGANSSCPSISLGTSTSADVDILDNDVTTTTTTTTTTTAAPTTTTTAAPTTTTTAAPTTTTTAAPTTTTTAAPTTTTTAAPTTTTTAGSTTTTTAGSTTTTTAGSTTTTTAGSTTTTTAGSTTTTTAAPTTTTTAGSTTTTTAAPTTTTTAGSTTTTAVATTTTTTTTAPTTTTTLPPGTPALTLVKTADPSTFDKEGVTINYSYLVSSIGNAPVIGPITVSDSRMIVTCPDVDTVGNFDNNLDVGESLICTSSLVTSQADLVRGYIFTSSVAEGANASTDDVETYVPYATVGIPTLSEWSMIMLSFMFLLMGVGYLRKRKMI